MRTLGHIRDIKGGWVYIMTNRPNGTLYVGTTTDLTRNIGQELCKGLRSSMGSLALSTLNDMKTFLLQNNVSGT
jgi:hypothetical protein